MLKSYHISIPPFNFKLSSKIPSVQRHIECIYQDHPNFTPTTDNFIDFNVQVKDSSGLRKLI